MCGSTYMLTQDEELWSKDLPPAVEQLLSEAKDPLADRNVRCTYKTIYCRCDSPASLIIVIALF